MEVGQALSLSVMLILESGSCSVANTTSSMNLYSQVIMVISSMTLVDLRVAVQTS